MKVFGKTVEGENLVDLGGCDDVTPPASRLAHGLWGPLFRPRLRVLIMKLKTSLLPGFCLWCVADEKCWIELSLLGSPGRATSLWRQRGTGFRVFDLAPRRFHFRIEETGFFPIAFPSFSLNSFPTRLKTVVVRFASRRVRGLSSSSRNSFLLSHWSLFSLLSLLLFLLLFSFAYKFSLTRWFFPFPNRSF